MLSAGLSRIIAYFEKLKSVVNDVALGPNVRNSFWTKPTLSGFDFNRHLACSKNHGIDNCALS
jgi:hypothetical protein